MATRIFPASRALVLILSGALACGGGDLLLPDPPGGGDNVVRQVVVVPFSSDRPGDSKQQQSHSVQSSPMSAASTMASTPEMQEEMREGQATANWVLGTAPGPQTVTARLVVGDAEPQIEEFTAQAKAAAPDTLSALSRTSQPGRRGHKAGTQPLVRVVDRFGNPVSDVPVAWQVTSGEGSVSEGITRTQTDGTSTVEWTLGNRPGLQRLTADNP